MIKHEEKYCPRCSASFICKSGDVGNCQCNEIKLEPATVEFLSKTYFDCLCKNCLAELQEKLQKLRGYRFPSQKEMLTEGFHYYREAGNWVFTENYHLLRGYCCNNGCRHCAYGFRKRES